MKLILSDGLNTFGARKKIWDSRIVLLGVKMGLRDRFVVPTVTYFVETWCRREEIDFMKTKSLRSKCIGTHRVVMRKDWSDRVDRKVSKTLWYV